MSESIYDWKRFWCPRSGSISLGDGGFLYDPDSEFGYACNPDLVAFSAISDYPCLILIGEPGIGKTHSIKVDGIERTETEGEQTISLDLGEYCSEDRLVRDLFENDKFKAWDIGSHDLHIFLDSFDECSLQITSITKILSGKFNKYKEKTDRLKLRIASRAVVWSETLERNLKEIWGKDSVGVYELAPLRRADVSCAAEAKGIESTGFLTEIYERNVIPLAIKPVTLEFLLKIGFVATI